MDGVGERVEVGVAVVVLVDVVVAVDDAELEADAVAVGVSELDPVGVGACDDVTDGVTAGLRDVLGGGVPLGD